MLIKKITQFIQQHDLIQKNQKIILGLSGGPDSVFLLHVLAQMHKKGEISLIAAHLDHEWRADSANDVKFCSELTSQLNVPLVTGKASELDSEAKFNGSQEEFGRKMRRQFLEQVKKNENADSIALAHHLQDQQETFFIRLIRGTGLSGLTAMYPKNGPYIRPVLEINKTDILDYLHQHSITYLTDPSNNLPEFLRNRIRHAVVPALQSCDKRFDDNFLTTLQRLQETEAFLQVLTEQTFQTLTKRDNNTLAIDLKKFFATHPVMQYRLLMHWLINDNVPFSPSQKFLDEIKRFLEQPGTKSHQLHATWKIKKTNTNAHILKVL